jgi:excisionase family DNA binding protein
MHDDLLNITQLAGRLGVRERVIQRYVDARTIPFLKLGKFLRFRWPEVETWLETLPEANPLKSHPAQFTDTYQVTREIPEVHNGTSPLPIILKRGARTNVSAESARDVST